MVGFVSPQSITYAAWSRRVPAKQKTPETRPEAIHNLIDFFISTFEASSSISPIIAEYLDVGIGITPVELDGSLPSSVRYVIPLPAFADELIARYSGNAKYTGPSFQNIVGRMIRWLQPTHTLLTWQRRPATATPDPGHASLSSLTPTASTSTDGFSEELLITKWIELTHWVAKLLQSDIQSFAQGVRNVAMAAMVSNSDMVIEVDNPGTSSDGSHPHIIGNFGGGGPDSVDHHSAMIKQEPTDPSSNPPLPGMVGAAPEPNDLEIHNRLLERIRVTSLMLSQFIQTQWSEFSYQISRLDSDASGPYL
ncbi:hypothetical protein BJ085DRAFT_36423, partial [Dimargaris cristalligena]